LLPMKFIIYGMKHMNDEFVLVTKHNLFSKYIVNIVSMQFVVC